jgi:DNA-binding MarR family transcriptional regulator
VPATSSQRDPNSQLEFVLHVVSRELARSYNDHFRKVDLSQTQAGVLLQVDWAKANTQTEIAQRLGIGKAAAGEVIIELEARGMLKRQRDPNDARRIEVSLTPAGRRKVKSINDFVARLGPIVLAGIDDDELERAMAVLLRVRDNLAALQGDDV